MVGRVLLLIAAFVVAGLGALLVFLYAQQADRRAQADADPQPALVVAADQGIPAGTPLSVALESGQIEQTEIAGAAIPPTALVDTTDRLEDIALTDLVAGEVVVAERFGDPASLQRLVVPEGLTAASFSFGDPNRVAGFVTPGSRVAVFATLTTEPTAQTDPVTGETVEREDTFTRLLLSDALVIGVGSGTTVTETTTAPDGGQQTVEVSQALLTLALDQTDIERLVLAQDLGELYLGLLQEGSDVGPGLGATEQNLFEDVTP